MPCMHLLVIKMPRRFDVHGLDRIWLDSMPPGNGLFPQTVQGNLAPHAFTLIFNSRKIAPQFPSKIIYMRQHWTWTASLYYVSLSELSAPSGVWARWLRDLPELLAVPKQRHKQQTFFRTTAGSFLQNKSAKREPGNPYLGNIIPVI